MLWGLLNLKHLERGDFLADVIEDLEEKANILKRMKFLVYENLIETS